MLDLDYFWIALSLRFSQRRRKIFTSSLRALAKQFFKICQSTILASLSTNHLLVED